MKKTIAVLSGLLIASAMAVASPKSSAMTGWVGDSKCKSKVGEAHAKCAKACVASGEKAVFVDDKDGKVYPIANQDSVKDHLGDHVKIMAANNDGTLQVDKVDAAAAAK